MTRPSTHNCYHNNPEVETCHSGDSCVYAVHFWKRKYQELADAIDAIFPTDLVDRPVEVSKEMFIGPYTITYPNRKSVDAANQDQPQGGT